MRVAQLLESLTLELELRTIDFSAVLESVIAGVPSTDRDRIDYTGPRPIALLGDEARMRFAIANLLRMTFECSLPGSRITLRAEQCGRCIQVSLLAAARPRDQHYIAVEIMRQVAEAHGGNVTASTAGDVFTIQIELAATGRSRRRFRDPSSLLVVDDNVQQLAALAELLRHHGLAIDCATSGHEALARIAVKIPDLLIVDVQLPDLSGVDVIRRARQHRPALPTALLTGYPKDHPMIARAIATTRAAYVAKPVNVDALLDVIAAALD